MLPLFCFLHQYAAPKYLLEVAFCKAMLLFLIINKTRASHFQIAIYSALHQLSTSLNEFILQRRLRAERWRRGSLLLLNKLYSIHSEWIPFSANKAIIEAILIKGTSASATFYPHILPVQSKV